MATDTTGTVEFDIDDAYEAYIESIEPGNMYAAAEAEMEKRAEEAWEAHCEAESLAMEKAWEAEQDRADREWELSYQRHILALKIIFALISLSAVLLAFGI